MSSQSSSSQHECSVSIDSEQESLRVANFRTTGPDIVSYFADVPEELIEAKFEQAIRMGVVALRASNTGEQVDFVEKRFNSLVGDFEDHIQAYLGAGGELPELIEEHFGEDGKLARELLDPSHPDSPVHRLQQNLQEDLQRLRTDLEVAEAEEELRQNMPQKGHEFEEFLDEHLGAVVSYTGDELRYTGDDTGYIGESKKGDFVVTMNPSGAKIAIEAKHSSMSESKIVEYMDEVIENRAADYGLYIARSINQLPKKTGWFKEVREDILVIAISDGDEGRFAHELLKTAYRWSSERVRAMSKEQTDDIDLASVRHQLEELERELQQFSELKRQTTKIENSANDLWDDIDKMQKEVERKFTALMSEFDGA